VSLMTRKKASQAAARANARRAASQLGPMATNVSRAARDGAAGARTWATPHVHRARSWAAPRVESAGHAVRDTIAPKVSDALVSAAQRLDHTPPARRRWPKLLGGIALFAAAGSAAAAVAIRRWSAAATVDNVSPAMTSTGSTVHEDPAEFSESEVNGKVRAH
jgi:hypothetical protein